MGKGLAGLSDETTYGDTLESQNSEGHQELQGK